jgi:glucosamine 6-phosphate synthetase-like amidotransferase/phosphosugar isomerase protein
MCGIGGVFLRDPSMRVNMDALRDTLALELQARGRHATGYVALDDDGVAEWQKAACSATEFIRECRPVPSSSRALLVHTRYATQGLAAFTENNHPIRRGPFFIIHNGHVSNDSELFRKAERNRFGKVDSEAIAALLAHEGELSRLHAVMAEIEGHAAVAAVDERDSSRLVVARGDSSPLFVYNGGKIVIFASTQDAIIKAHAKHVGTLSTKNLSSVQEGQMWEWSDTAFSITPFEVKRRTYKYVPTSSYRSAYAWEGREGYAWETSLERQIQAATSYSTDDEEAKETVEKNKRSWSSPSGDKAWRIADGSAMISCDNCGHAEFEEDVDYRHDAEEGITWILCKDCVDQYDDLDFLSSVEDGDDDEDQTRFSFRSDDEESGIIDDYEGANSSIVRRMADRWFSI